MEIDNLKELWNKDMQEPPEISIERQNEIYSPLEMIRINMKTEFWILIITLPGMLYGFPFDDKDVNIKTISAFQVFLSVCFMTYFYTRFIKLYKMLKSTGINTNYDLFNIKTQLIVCKEIYIAYYIAFIPLAVLIALINVNFHLDNVYYIFMFGVSMLTSVLVVFIMIKFWIHHMYGKYIYEVVSIIDDLNGIKNSGLIHKNNSWFDRSQNFLRSKYGLKGHVFNTVVWFFTSYILLTVILLVIICVIFVIGIKLDIIDKATLFKMLAK